MRTPIAITIMLTASLMAAPAPGGSPEEMLEAAIYQAKVLGNLPGAIRQLESIAARYAGKPVAARALAEIGQAQEQLGNPGLARNAYTRVLKEYPGQVQLVAQVRQNLESIAEAPAGPRNLSFERGEVGKVPEGWFVPSVLAKEGYSAELRRSGCHSAIGCVVVLAPAAQPANSFGNLMQSFSAAAYRGKTVRLHAWLRLEAAAKADAAQMWLRVDRTNREMGFFDNMQNRPVRSAAWTEAQIVGRIDDDAERINVGLMSIGGGRAWMDDVSFEVVTATTPTTGLFEAHNWPKEPVNLSFQTGETGSVPDGWFAPAGRSELSRQGCRGAACAAIRLEPDSTQPFGNLMQTVNATSYRGKTVRIRAWLRVDSTSPSDSAQMWFRVDRPKHEMGAFDNMGDRRVKSAEWTQAEIVAKVAADAEVLNLWVMSVGKGRAWVDGVTFEIVPDSTPVTARTFAPNETPQNLDFAQGQVGKAPDGWFAPAGRAELSHQGCRGAACAAIWLEPNSTQPFGNLMQTVNAAAYRGKTVRIRAWLRLDATAPGNKAQMWFRVDLPNKKMGAFDNMGDRPVQSATWTQAEIVAKVADDAGVLNIGVMSIGKGRAWVDGVTFEIVPDGTPVTGKTFAPSETPQNLDFAQGQVGKVPDGWIAPVGRAELSHQGCRGAACAAIWLDPDSTQPFGNLMQTVKAASYRGKTVRLRAWLRLDATGAGDKAQMWFRVDLPNRGMDAFDNMDDRPVRSAAWTQAEIVGKVAADADVLNVGVISVGKGRAWVDGITLEVVPDATPSTGAHRPQ